MSNSPPKNMQAVPTASGSVIGFVDTSERCESITRALTRCGVAIERIRVIRPSDGLELFRQMLQGLTWGEESERMLKQGEKEIASGHYVYCVEAKERDEGLHIARVALSQGGYGFCHFGELTDEQLTP